MRSLRLVLLPAAAALAACATLHAGWQLPLIQDVTYFPPSSFTELCTSSDLIVRARIDGATVRLPRSPKSQAPEDQSVLTEWRVQVLDALKVAGAPPTGILTVLQRAGEAEVNGRKIKVDDTQFPALQRAGMYVLFLRWNSDLGGYEINYGPTGAYVVAGRRLSGPGESEVAIDVKAQSLEVLEARIRDCGK